PEQQADESDQPCRGRSGQPRQPWFEDPLNARFDSLDLRDQALELGLANAATVYPCWKPGARPAKHHLGRYDHQWNGEKDAGARREREAVDGGENEQEATPRARVKLR